MRLERLFTFLFGFTLVSLTACGSESMIQMQLIRLTLDALQQMTLQTHRYG